MSNVSGNEVTPFWEELGVPLVTLPVAKKAILSCFRSGTIPCIVGNAGIGKTELLKQIAQEYNWGYFDWYTQLCQAEDIIGLPFRDPANSNVFKNLVDAALWEAVTKHEEGILVFEEVNRASQPTSSAVFAFMDKKGAGSFALPAGWKIAIAQNPSGGEYSVNDLEKDHAFRRRVTWLAVREDLRAWLDYATKAKFHPLVVNYVKANPTHLLDATARASGKTYANPASWEKVSKALTSMETAGLEIGKNLTVLHVQFSGDIGIGIADLFVEFVQDDSLILSPTEVIESYSDKKSNISKRVTRALNEGHVDKITTLIGNLVRELLVYKPTPTPELASNIGKFFLDLPDQLRGTLFNEFTKSQGDDDEEYVKALNYRLALDTHYTKAVRAQSNTVERVEDEIAGSS